MEDAGFYCIDNLPAGLLRPLVENMKQAENSPDGIAISIDARNMIEDLSRLPALLSEIKVFDVQCEIIYLDAKDSTLITRFSETRRKHPLSDENTGLREAISREKSLLEPIATLADLVIDTTDLNLYELRDLIKQRVAQHDSPGLAILFESFGFKRGVPVDADFVFDVRCLPNPYWHKELREYNGTQQPIIDFLGGQDSVKTMLDDITAYLEKWLPQFTSISRNYLTVAIGCTGGQHRSVYISEALQQHFAKKFANVQVRHKEIGDHSP